MTKYVKFFELKMEFSWITASTRHQLLDAKIVSRDKMGKKIVAKVSK